MPKCTSHDEGHAQVKNPHAFKRKILDCQMSY